MSKTKRAFVIHVHEMKDYPDAVYIGREIPRQGIKRSIWANRYTVKRYGRETALRLFEQHKEELPLHKLHELEGKPLACWCRRSDEPWTPDHACHGDILAELVNKRSAER